MPLLKLPCFRMLFLPPPHLKYPVALLFSSSPAYWPPAIASFDWPCQPRASSTIHPLCSCPCYSKTKLTPPRALAPEENNPAVRLSPLFNGRPNDPTCCKNIRLAEKENIANRKRHFVLNHPPLETNEASDVFISLVCLQTPPRPFSSFPSASCPPSIPQSSFSALFCPPFSARHEQSQVQHQPEYGCP